MKNKNGFIVKLLALTDLAVFVIAAKIMPYLSHYHIIIGVLSVIFILMLYVADFYSLRHSRFFKFAAVFLAVLGVFDVINIVIQYFFLYELVYGRKVLLTLNTILFIYFTYRWVLINRFALSRVINIYVLESENTEKLMKKIDEAMRLKNIGKCKTHLCRFDNGLKDSYGKDVDVKSNTVVIDSFHRYDEKIVNAVLRVKINGGNIMTYENFCEIYLEKIPVETISDEWLILSRGFENIFHSFYVRAKRIFDICVSLFGLVTASPLLIAAAIAIKLDSKGPVIFTQVRSNLHGGTFTIYKLRSMRTDAETAGAKWASKNDNRITRVGNFLRKTRIDEIPQLINVLIGDMSFIGPRPERPEFDRYLEEQIPYYMLRYLVKPGLTGWAQVNHGYGATLDDAVEKLMYDLYYIKNYSFLLDLRIILRTVHIVLFGKGR